MAKILVVDDDTDIRDIYSEVLKEAGYEVDLAKDGEEGLKKILLGGFDLILLDIMMPKIDGISVLRKLKETPPGSYNGPVIMLSQLNEEKIKEVAFDLGAKGYLIKSDLTPDQVISKISEIISNTPKTA